MKTLFTRRRAIGFLVFLGFLFLIRPEVPSLRAKVSRLLTIELGRRVEIGALKVRFFPRPALELENVLIQEQAGFSSEPLLRSPDVTAQLRVSALVRGRIEIAGLVLNQASLNLTRDPAGKWNFEDLVERTARSSTAPTASGRREPRTKFPYIEASAARINFKNGLEKTHFAVTDADFALWQQSDNQWGIRVRARPIRTDSNLTDTGLVSLNGTWQRSPLVANTPLEFSVEWKQAQIGQVSKLVYGSDQGWRGNVTLATTILGTPRSLRLLMNWTIDDFRRYDVLGGGNLRLLARCVADYSAYQRSLANLDCSAPAGDGLVELKGNASGLPFSTYDFALDLKDVPAQVLLGVARHLNRNVPEDFLAEGRVNAGLEFSRRGLAAISELRGQGETAELSLRSLGTSPALDLGHVPFTLTSSSDPKASDSGPEVRPEIEAGPINLALGRPTPLQARAVISGSGYHAWVRGEAKIKRLLDTAHLLKIPAPDIRAEGDSTISLSLAGAWDGTPPLVTGTAEIGSVRARIHGLNSPLEVRSAQLMLDPRWVRVTNFQASAAQADWRGWLLVPRPCARAESCGLEFRLHSAELKAAALNELLNPLAAKTSWYRFFSSGSPSYLLSTRARGRVVIDRLILGRVWANQFSSDLNLEQGKLTLDNLRGEVLGGQLAGAWKADFSSRPPSYRGSGSFDSIGFAQVSQLIDDIAGSGSARYQFESTGWNLGDLLDSANLDATFLIRDGVFPRVVLSQGAPALRASSFSGKVRLRDGKFSFADTHLETAGGVYDLSGTASLQGALDLKMTSESSTGYALSGTLGRTHVSPLPSLTRASLEP